MLADDETAITGNLAPFPERSGFALIVAANGQRVLGLASNSWRLFPSLHSRRGAIRVK